MANPYKAEMDFVVAGQKIRLHMGIDEIIEVEGDLGYGFGRVYDEVQRAANYKIARAMLVATSGGKLDQAAAGNLLWGGGIVEAWPQIVKLVFLALPPPVEVGDADPPVPPAAESPPSESGNGTG